MAPTKPNATLCHSRKYNYSMVIITIVFIHLVCFSFSGATNVDSYNGGFSAHLIRRDSQNSPLYNHKRNKVFRRLMGPETPQTPLTRGPNGGNFLMKLSFGAPPFDVYAVADTGSGIAWTQCQPCKSCTKTKNEMFDPKKSSTYGKITCQQSECRLFDDHSPENYCENNSEAACMFSVTYADDSYSAGEVAKEVISLMSKSGKVVTFKDIVIGCAQNQSSSNEESMAIIGLDKSPVSFISQISSYVGGKKFSYCLVPIDADPKIESIMYFGNESEVSGEGVVSTALADKTDPKYYVTMRGITIGDDFVPFNSTRTLLEKGNTLIDSGTTQSYLPQDFYKRVVNQLVDKLEPKVKPFNYIDDSSSRTCFNYTTTIPKGPDMDLNFEDGGKLQLKSTTYMLNFEDEKFVCLAFMNNTNQGFDSDDIGVLGHILQRNIWIGFDLDRNLASFKQTDCVEMSSSRIVTHLFPIFTTCLLYFLLFLSMSF